MAWNQKLNIKGPKGDKGDKGDPGEVGPAGLNWRGAWSASNSYAINDSVSWGGSTYFATAAQAAGSAPPTGTSADPGADDAALNAGWAVLSLQGTKGDKGDKGDTGNTGQAGARGSRWFDGAGVPGAIVGSAVGDYYLDRDTGDVYELS